MNDHKIENDETLSNPLDTAELDDISEIDDFDDSAIISAAATQIIGHYADKLGFNADWFENRGAQQNKYELIRMIIAVSCLSFLAVGLYLLVDKGRLDSTTFGTLLSVIVGAILNQTLTNRNTSKR